MFGHASRYGQALIDRRLYLPDVWAQDESKRTKAGVPEEITFVTKPQMACALIAAALDAGVPCAWVLADALYGSDLRLRRMLETREQPYVLAVRSNHCLRFWTEEGLEETNPAAMADALARDAWATHAAGEGAKGLRLYEWARIALSSTAAPGFEPWLLIRRSRREPDKRAYDLPLRRLVSRWANWPARRGCAGRLRSALSAPRTISVSTIARRAPGMGGTGT